MILYQPNWFTKIVFSWKLWVPWSWFWRQNDRKTILYNPPFDGSVHRARFHNFISSFIKEGCCFGTNFSGILGVFGPNGGLGSQDSVYKVWGDVYKNWHLFTKNGKIIFIIFLLVSEQRRRSWNWCRNWMKCSCGWSLLSSASQPQWGSDIRVMIPADFIW